MKRHHFIDVPPPGPYEIWTGLIKYTDLPHEINVALPDGTVVRETLTDFAWQDDGNLRLWLSRQTRVSPDRIRVNPRNRDKR